MINTSLRLDHGRPVAPSEGALRPLGIDDVRITSGFWADRQILNAENLIEHCEYWAERAGWIGNFDAAREGRLPAGHSGRSFADSDVYKLLEAMAWEVGRTGDEAMNCRLETIVQRIVPVQEADGYLNTYFGRPGQEPRYSDLEWGHELYCYGHLIQAAIARGRTVGEDLLVDIARRAADHVCETFGVGGIERVCGHPEIEVALVEFARYTGDNKYLEQAKLFIERRGHRTLADIEYDARPLEAGVALSFHPRVGIFQRGHDPCHARPDQGVGAGRRLAEMRARLERDIDRGATRSFARLGQRIGLGVRPAAVARAAAADDVAVFHDHAADGRVGPGPPERPARQRERRAHHRVSP